MPKVPTLSINNKPIAIGVDGHGIIMREAGFGDIAFFQIVDQTPENISAIGVATVRMTPQQLGALRDAIDNVLKQHAASIKTK